MVYITRWEDFETAAIELYKKSPTKARYCVKFRPKDGELVLKVTDDFKCLKFKTRSSIILNRFEALNLRLLLSMSARPLPAPASSTTAATTKVPSGVDSAAGTGEKSVGAGEAGGDVVMKDATGETGGAGASTGGKTGGGKKKKKGKK